MRLLRFLRHQPAVLLLAVPVFALAMLAVVGPGAAESVTPAAKASPEVTTTVVTDAAAGVEVLSAAEVPLEAGSDSSIGGSGSGSAATSNGTSSTGGANAAPLSSSTASEGLVADSEVPPSAVVSESSSPVVQVAVAGGVVAIALAGYAFWRRGRGSR